MGDTIAEIKSRKLELGKRVTRAEAFDKAWRQGFRGNFSLVDKIYHPDYSSFDYRAGLEVNLEMDKVVMSTLSEQVTKGPTRTIFEDDNFLCIEQKFKSMQTDEPTFSVTITTITYLNGLIITQESVVENVSDPSEGKNWNWDDYE